MNNNSRDLFSYFLPKTVREDKVPHEQSLKVVTTKEACTNEAKSVPDSSCVNEERIDCELESACLDKDEQEALLDDHEESEQEIDKKELTGGSGPAKNTNSEKVDKKPQLNRGTFIAYAGKTISITKLFSEEAIEALDMEDVRKILEKSFPELSKQRTHMDWDEKKNVICPIVSKGKKGSYFIDGLKGFFFKSRDLFEHKEVVNILAAKDGYYDVRDNPIGIFVTKVDKIDELEDCCEGFRLALPKIPYRLLSQLITFFCDFSMKYEVEVLGVFYWDSKRLEYILDIPNQSVSKCRVYPEYSHLPFHLIKVAEVHSHNTMKAVFSEIDDEDEAATMLFGVVGEISKTDNYISFDMVLRAGVARKFLPVQPHVLFEGVQSKSTVTMAREEYPSEWRDMVSVTTQSESLGGVQ